MGQFLSAVPVRRRIFQSLPLPVSKTPWEVEIILPCPQDSPNPPYLLPPRTEDNLERTQSYHQMNTSKKQWVKKKILNFLKNFFFFKKILKKFF